jgi:hypothetical protein
MFLLSFSYDLTSTLKEPIFKGQPDPVFTCMVNQYILHLKMENLTLVLFLRSQITWLNLKQDLNLTIFVSSSNLPLNVSRKRIVRFHEVNFCLEIISAETFDRKRSTYMFSKWVNFWNYSKRNSVLWSQNIIRNGNKTLFCMVFEHVIPFSKRFPKHFSFDIWTHVSFWNGFHVFKFLSLDRI